MTIQTLLLTLIIFGAFGGMLDILQLIDVKRLIQTNDEYISSRQRFLFALLLGSVGGIGGALAVLFIIAASGKFPKDESAETLALLSPLFVISGFLGYRILKSVAAKVEKQIEDLEKRTDEKIKVVAEKTESEVQYLDAISSGLICAEKPDVSNSATIEAIVKLRGVLKDKPTDRKAGIILGRIYKKQKDYTTAIKTLSDIVDAREKDNLRDADTAAFYYNRACYQSLLAQENKNDDLKEKAYKDLEMAIKLDFCNKDEAKEDNDFDHLKNEEKFKKLIS